MTARYRNSISLAMLLWLLPGASSSQIPNAGFESWGGGNPSGWGTSNDPIGNFFNVFQSSVAHGGAGAVRGIVVTVEGYRIQPVLQTGPDGEGFSHTTRSTNFTGYYQFFPQGGDRFSINVALFKGGVNGTPIAVAAALLSPSVATYTQFNVPFQYLSGDTPDTCVVQIMIIGPTIGNDQHEGSYFILDDIALSGTTDVDRQVSAVPTVMELRQNYPNPFNPSTTMRYGLPHKSQVSLMVYNNLGQLVSQLVSGEQEAGYHEVRFDASGLSSGVYFYRLVAENFVQTRKLLLLR